MKKFIGVAIATVILTTSAAYADMTTTEKIVTVGVAVGSTALLVATAPASLPYVAVTGVVAMVASKEVDETCKKRENFDSYIDRDFTDIICD